jgi:hypothetical protein
LARIQKLQKPKKDAFLTKRVWVLTSGRENMQRSAPISFVVGENQKTNKIQKDTLPTKRVPILSHGQENMQHCFSDFTRGCEQMFVKMKICTRAQKYT